MHEKLGKVVTVVFGGCSFHHINEVNVLQPIVVNACHRAGATVLGSKGVQFFHEEQEGVKDGASAIALLGESHAAGHSWPRQGYLVCVVYTCGDINPEKITSLIGESVKTTQFKVALLDLDQLLVDPNVPWVSADT